MPSLEAIKVGATKEEKVAKKIIDRTKMSKAHAKIVAKIEVLETKKKREGLTRYEAKLLLNARAKIEFKNLSQWYKFLKTQSKAEIKVLCGSALPPFKMIMENAPQYKAFSYWDLLGILSKIAKANDEAKKA